METNIKVLLKSLAGYAPNIRKKGLEVPSTVENKEKNDVILERALCFNF